MLPDWEYRSRDAEPDSEKVFEYTVPSFSPREFDQGQVGNLPH